MKKVLIGVGIGCGLIVLVGIVAVVAGGIWAKGKIEGMAEGTEKMQKQEEHVARLNQSYAFKEPPKGQPLLLTEDRLKDYFKVREPLKQAFTSYEQETKQFEAKPGEEPDLSKGLQALGTLMEGMAKVREKWLEQLESQKMSPAEFTAITAALYSSPFGKMKGEMRKNQRAMYEQLKGELERQANDENLPAAAREGARKEAEKLEKKIAALPPADAPPSEDVKIHTANAALFEKYQQQINEGANPGLDILLLGQAGGMDAAFENALGGDADLEPLEDTEPSDELPGAGVKADDHADE